MLNKPHIMQAYVGFSAIVEYCTLTNTQKCNRRVASLPYKPLKNKEVNGEIPDWM